MVIPIPTQLTPNISDDLLLLFHQQIVHELFNSQLYKYIGAVLKNIGLDNIGDFFFGEASEATGEISHQLIVINYLIDRNMPVEFLPIPDLGFTLDSTSPTLLKDIGEKYVAQEKQTTQYLKNITGLALEQDDFLSYDLGLGMLHEQREEEALSQSFLDKVNLLGTSLSEWVLFDKDFELK